MISYAQNGEDVVLARALPFPKGFYVDVGAADPDRASVTKHFYGIGWSGINVEPRLEAAQRLALRRPRDVTLNCAAGSHAGFAVLEFDDDPDQAQTRQTAGGGEGTVAVRTLSEILESQDVTDIDFLKIDVEGAEREVLEGLDLGRWRPKVIVIEAVLPWSHVRSDHEWRHLLEDAGYREGGFDGLNLYFAPAEAGEILERLAPASVLDAYEPESTALLREELERVSTYVRHLEAELTAETKASVVPETPYPQSPLGEEVPAPAEGQEARYSDVPLRFAMIATPRSGNTWVRRVLADALNGAELPAHHPADFEWQALPERCCLQLHWPRTQLLVDVLAEHDVVPVVIARHPLDTLLSVLAFAQKEPGTGAWLDGEGGDETSLRGATPDSGAFVDWATSARAQALLAVTPSWWTDPATFRLRYEDLVRDPVAIFSSLLVDARVDPVRDIATCVTENNPTRLAELSGGVHVWRARPGAWEDELSPALARKIAARHAGVFDILGYSLP